jgi:hypothetical protein
MPDLPIYQKARANSAARTILAPRHTEHELLDQSTLGRVTSGRPTMAAQVYHGMNI